MWDKLACRNSPFHDILLETQNDYELPTHLRKLIESILDD